MEKKKIAPRKIASADEQERALGLLLGKDDKVTTKKVVVDSDSDDEMLQKVVTKKDTSTKKKQPVKPEKQPRTIRRTASEILRPTVEVQRVTIDLPIGLYDKLREETEKSGVTFRFQIISLLKKHFDLE